MKYILLIILAGFCANALSAEIHKWVDENGNIHYSDTKPEHIQSTEVKIDPQPKASSHSSAQIQHQAQRPEPQSKTNPYARKKRIVMYGASWCGYCKQARQFFRKHKIRYTEYDIDQNPAARKRYQQLGGTGVPLIVYRNKSMQGFSEERFEKFYTSL